MTADPALLELAHPYALDAVTPFERRGIENSLAATDPDTRAAFTATVYGIRETLSLMTVFDAAEPPAELEEAILRAIDGVVAAQAREHADAGRWRIRRERTARRTQQTGHAGAAPNAPVSGWLSRRWQVAAAAAAAVIAIGAGAAVLTHRSEPPAAALTAQSIQSQPDSLTRTAPVATGGDLVIYSSAVISAAAVTFDHIAAPPPGRAYQLWLVPLGGTPVSAGVLPTVPPPGSALVIRFGNQDTLALTLEPAGGSAQPTTTPIAALNLT